MCVYSVFMQYLIMIINPQHWWRSVSNSYCHWTLPDISPHLTLCMVGTCDHTWQTNCCTYWLFVRVCKQCCTLQTFQGENFHDYKVKPPFTGEVLWSALSYKQKRKHMYAGKLSHTYKFWFKCSVAYSAIAQNTYWTLNTFTIAYKTSHGAMMYVAFFTKPIHSSNEFTG